MSGDKAANHSKRPILLPPSQPFRAQLSFSFEQDSFLKKKPTTTTIARCIFQAVAQQYLSTAEFVRIERRQDESFVHLAHNHNQSYETDNTQSSSSLFQMVVPLIRKLCPTNVSCPNENESHGLTPVSHRFEQNSKCRYLEKFLMNNNK